MLRNTLTKDRVEFDDTLNSKDIKNIINNPDIKFVQTSGNRKSSCWKKINRELLTKRSDIELRIWGSYQNPVNLSFLKLIPNVQIFSADCIRKVTNIQCIKYLENIDSLSIGIYHLDDFEFLSGVSPKLKKLYIGETFSKKPDLSVLERFSRLQTVYINGQYKNVETLSELKELEKITLRSVTASNLKFLQPLKKLWYLDLKLGGTNNLSDLSGLENIKYLELWQIRKLENIDVISQLPGLQNLFLQSLPNIKVFPETKNLHHLRRIRLQNLKNLTNFKSLEFSPKLEEFQLIQGEKQNPDDLVSVLRNKNLKRAGAYFGSDKKNQLFVKLLEEYNKSEFQFEKFKYT